MASNAAWWAMSSADLKGLKFVTVERSFAEKHYEDLSAKPFFAGLVEYIISGPVVATVWEGKNVVVTGRKMIGATLQTRSLGQSVAIMPLKLDGMSSMEVIQLRMLGRRLLCGSQKVCPTGRATSTPGSTSKTAAAIKLVCSS